MDFLEPIDKRIHKPKKIKSFKSAQIKYENAEELISKISLTKNARIFTFIPGNFIFGDLIEALVVKNNYHIKEMTISTLSLSGPNVDSLNNLLNGDYVDKLTLIVSDYFYSHEKWKLIQYIYKTLDLNKTQLSVYRGHAKVCIFETYNGLKVVMHGSANLRSSDNIEQIDIEENEQIFDYISEFYTKIALEQKTIKKCHQDDKVQRVKAGKTQQKKGTRKEKNEHKINYLTI